MEKRIGLRCSIVFQTSQAKVVAPLDEREAPADRKSPPLGERIRLIQHIGYKARVIHHATATSESSGLRTRSTPRDDCATTCV